MILLAVSGGPDSMFMLNDQLKKYGNNQIVVAFVNYNQRSDSNIDQKIVEDFCLKYHIQLEKLILSKQDYQKNNFQEWARNKRYDFFYEIYTKYNCQKLLVAQHKDDFLETAIMQEKRKKVVNYYGIKKHSILFKMNVERPYLFKFFKKEIEAKNKKNGINFAIDYTNNSDKYERNAIRHLLEKSSNFYKNCLILKFRIKNKWLAIKAKRIERIYKRWQSYIFSQDFFAKIRSEKDKLSLIYKLINEKFDGINLTKNKILSIIDFIISKNRTSTFLLKNNIFLVKKQGKLIFKFDN
ncbi:tRNA lysidine(34) synthetase TilS [Mycoplasmopsis hyopharyngis]|uniref:tRNA lysidine(34) synthetase TilS n=1 Tax=Mycoplasmopsis hyopharyngis TaxID=29558 RepID=UPI00387332BA